jgi:uncharacterized protein
MSTNYDARQPVALQSSFLTMCNAPDENIQESRVFLSAEWRDLVMLNYEVDRALLEGYVPPGTVLDSFEGRTYVSLVGFQFRQTKLFGSLGIPFHTDFDEVNLRFYVRRRGGSEDRRGVVFIAEIVPKWAVARIARLAYGENYVCLPMQHSVNMGGAIKTAEYEWQLNGARCKLYARTSGAPARPSEGSLEQFITEHYWGYSAKRSAARNSFWPVLWCAPHPLRNWGYSAKRNGDALEYHVSHVPWNVWASSAAGFEGDASGLYGLELGKVLGRRPDSAFIADGSPVTVSTGKRIPRVTVCSGPS